MGPRVKQTILSSVLSYPALSSEDEGSFSAGCGGLATRKAFLAPALAFPKPSSGLTVTLWTVSCLSSWWYTETADGARDLEKNDTQFRGPRPQCWMWRKGLGSLVVRGAFPGSSPCGRLCLRLSGSHRPIWFLKGLYKVSWGKAHIHFVSVPPGPDSSLHSVNVGWTN